MPSDITQISFGGGVISEATLARLDLAKFGTAVRTADNYFVHAEGGISNRAGTEFIHRIKDASSIVRDIPFDFNEDQSYALEFSNLLMRVYQNGGILQETATTITGATQANPVVVTDVGHPYANGNEIQISGIVGMTELNGKFYTIANVAANTYELVGIDGTGFTTYSSGGSAKRTFELVTPYLGSELAALKYRQSNDVMYLTHRNHAPRKLARTGPATWTLTTMLFVPVQAAPTSVVVTPVGTGGSTTWNYRVTAISLESGEESVVANGSTTVGNAALSSTNYNRITFTAAAGAERYNVYKEDNGLYGLVGSTETTTFDDKNLAADLNDTAPALRQPFNAAGDYPGAVGLHEQRSAWGNTTNDPLTVWLSQTSQFENMSVSNPTKASDAVTVRLVTGKGNEIRHFRSFQERLFMFTSGAVWSIRPGGNDDAITPASKKLSVEEYLSSTDVPPLTIKQNILMVAGKANKGFEVHSLGYDLQSDAYAGSDLTVLARDLFKGYTIDEWAFAERPHRLVACKRSDGKLVVMAYLQEHQIFAWSVWGIAGGTVESICSVPEAQEDFFYVVVKRTINGVAVKYQERVHTRDFATIENAFFVDSGLTLDTPITISGATKASPVVISAVGHGIANGSSVRIRDITGAVELNNRSFTTANATANTFELVGIDGTAYTTYVSGGTVRKEFSTVSGLDHLEGETVIALADGNLVTFAYESDVLVVVDGQISLPNPASIVHVGLPYTGTLVSLPLNLATRVVGQTAGLNKIVKEVTLRVKDTRGIFVGPSADKLEEYASRSTELWGGPAATLNGMIKIPISGDWDRDAGVTIQTNPGLPQTILSMTASTDVGH